MLENNCLSKLRLHLAKSYLFKPKWFLKLMIHKSIPDLRILRNKGYTSFVFIRACWQSQGDYQNLACRTAFMPWNGSFQILCSSILLNMLFYKWLWLHYLKSPISVYQGLCLLIECLARKSGNICTQPITTLWICILIHFWEKDKQPKIQMIY